MIDINKILGKPVDRASIVHSSGLGKVAQGQAFGATSSESFASRRMVEANRQYIGNYKNASVHATNSTPVRPFSSGIRADVTPQQQRQQPLRAAPPPPRGGFSSPPRRPFQP